MTEPDTKLLRDRFEAHESGLRKSSYRQAAILATVFIVAASGLDYVVFNDHFVLFLKARLITAVLLLAVWAGLGIVDKRSLSFRLMGNLVALLPMLSIEWMVYKTGGGDSVYYGGLNTVLVGAALILRWSTIDSIISATLCIGIYLYISFMMGLGYDPAKTFTHFYFIFVTAVFACLGTYFYNRIRFREFLLVTEVEGAKTELEETNKQLRTIDETKSRFFANLSHELRTPLTLILGPAEHLRANEKIHGDAQLEEQINTIEDNGYRLLRLINDILDLVKLDSGESPARPERIDLEDFIKGLVSNLKPIAELKEVKISSRCHVDTRPEVWLDRGHLEKIILNLAVNALKFTSAGGSVVITADVVGDDLHLTVADTGEGMSEEDASNVFVRFWQADMSAKRKHRGAGIGLSLVKSLAESMGGDVQVQSKLGEGTTFRVSMPAPSPLADAEKMQLQGPDADILEKFNERARVRTESSIAGNVKSSVGNGHTAAELEPIKVGAGEKRKRILVADDEEGMRRFVATQLSEHYDLIEAGDGQEAWDLVVLHKPDLVITDLMMPVMDGIELTRKIREDKDLPRIPIILITAQASEAPRLEALAAGVNDFISKPFSTVELSVRAKNLLDSSEFELQLTENNVRLGAAYDQLKKQESLLVQTEKLTSLGRMSAGIVHEVNNPLNYTKIALHTLRSFKSQLDKDEQSDFLEVLVDAEEGVKRVIGIISDLRSFTRGDTVSTETLKLRDVVESSRKLTSAMLSGIELVIEVDPAIKIEGNEGQLCQLFMNFLQNSARAIETKSEQSGPFAGKIILRAKPQDDGGVRLTLRDNGCGISAEDIDQIYEPFFTKNDVGEGMGLGLSICHSILKQHHAQIHVESEVGEFTEFSIDFTR